MNPLGGKRRCILEFDCWPAPTQEHYIGVLVHVLTDSFQPFTLLLYADRLGTPETAANQAQRILHVIHDLVGFPLSELVWAVQSDNTGKAANVAKLLEVVGLRCVCHLLALGPAHLLHPQRRQHNKAVTFVMHEDGVRACYDLCEKVRRLAKYLYNHVDERDKLRHEATPRTYP